MSDHFDGRRYFNPHNREARGLREVIRWQRTHQPAVWPAHVPLRPHQPPPAQVAPGQVAATFIGHATFLLRTSSMVILTDPVFTTHAGPFGRFGPRRVREPGVAVSALPPIDPVLISHNHYDHLQPASIHAFRDATFVTALGLAGFLRSTRRQTGHRARLVGADAGWTSARDRRSGAALLGAHAFRSNRTLWCGFVVEVDGLSIYFAGEAATPHRSPKSARRCGPSDLALLPIGAYEPRWFMQPMHMNPEEAVRAHLDARARRSLGMHFGTFQLTDEAIDDPLLALARARDAAGVSADALATLDFGQTGLFAAADKESDLQEVRRSGDDRTSG